MELRRKYLTYVVLAFAPQLHGCLWESLHLDGTLDASSKAEEVAPSKDSEGDVSSEKEEN